METVSERIVITVLDSKFHSTVADKMYAAVKLKIPAMNNRHIRQMVPLTANLALCPVLTFARWRDSYLLLFDSTLQIFRASGLQLAVKFHGTISVSLLVYYASLATISTNIFLRNLANRQTQTSKITHRRPCQTAQGDKT